MTKQLHDHTTSPLHKRSACYSVLRCCLNPQYSCNVFTHVLRPLYTTILLTVTFTYFWVTIMEAKLEISILRAHVIHHLIWLLSPLLGWTFVSNQKISCITGNIQTCTGRHNLLTLYYFLNSVSWSLSYFITKRCKGSMQGDKKEWRGSFPT